MTSGIFVFPPRLTHSFKGQALSDTAFTGLNFSFPTVDEFVWELPSCFSICWNESLAILQLLCFTQSWTQHKKLISLW